MMGVAQEEGLNGTMVIVDLVFGKDMLLDLDGMVVGRTWPTGQMVV